VKYAMFLQDLELSREDTKALLKHVGCVDHTAIWLDEPNVEELFDDVEIVVAVKHQVGRAELERFPNARMVSLAFTGYNDVDRRYCESREPPLLLYYAPGYSTDSVAELTVNMAQSLLRFLPLAHRRVVAKKWDGAEKDEIRVVPGMQLRGRKVGIIGTGTIGLRTAEIFHYGFRCPLIGWSRNGRKEFEELGGIYCDTIDDVFQQADIVSLHLQLIEGVTEHTANAERIALLRENSILLNTARTGLVDLDALVNALKNRRFLGAGLDVTEKEHLRDDLLGLDNIILSPHVGYRTDRALKNLARVTIENIGRFLKDDLTNRVLLSRYARRSTTVARNNRTSGQGQRQG